MAVLFAAGAMSFGWATAISPYILAERLLPLGGALDRAAGAALCAWAHGSWRLVSASDRSHGIWRYNCSQ